ncbi:helix-turn-helix transcriptional regulator, partial [Enterococcus casseliflavus]|uniref:XRE family transcriptional regulator n=1 Tax=Enterococcus casseliflavus TaxID=37734 RepID=UPI002FDC017A
MPNPKTIFGMVIKHIRKSKKMTQKELSQLTGFSQNTISNHENGVRSLGEKEIDKYAKAFKISIEEFMSIAYNFNENHSGTVKNLPYFLNKRMDELGVTEEDLYKKTKISKNNYRSLQNGNLTNIPMNVLLNICSYLNMSTRHFFDDIDYFESMEEYEKS